MSPMMDKPSPLTNLLITDALEHKRILAKRVKALSDCKMTFLKAMMSTLKNIGPPSYDLHNQTRMSGKDAKWSIADVCYLTNQLKLSCYRFNNVRFDSGHHF